MIIQHDVVKTHTPALQACFAEYEDDTVWGNMLKSPIFNEFNIHYINNQY